MAKAFHWAMTPLLLAQSVLGWIAVSLPLSPAELELLVRHKPPALSILALLPLWWGEGRCVAKGTLRLEGTEKPPDVAFPGRPARTGER